MSDALGDKRQREQGAANVRGRADFVGHTRIHLPAVVLDPSIPINNIIIAASSERGRWLEEAMSAIGEWRAIVRSAYIRWAIAINGLFVASQRYLDPDWQAEKQFVICSLRSDSIEVARPVAIAQWAGGEASKRHLETVPMLAAYGIIDLFACLEEWLFAMYRIFLNQHPGSLLKGDEFRTLRQLWRKAQMDPSFQLPWQELWSKRLVSWQHRRLYDGLEKVFLAFFAETGLETPSNYTLTTVQTECFTDQLLSAVNLSLMEHKDAGK